MLSGTPARLLRTGVRAGVDRPAVVGSVPYNLVGILVKNTSNACAVLCDLIFEYIKIFLWSIIFL